MDRIISARVDETAAARIGALARRLGVSKKKVLERAIEALAEQVDRDTPSDVFEQTCGAWQRKESPAQTVAAVREAFGESMERRRR